MARPIAPTPKLDTRSSEEFLNRVERDLRTPAPYTPTPKVDKIIKVIMCNAVNRQK